MPQKLIPNQHTINSKQFLRACFNFPVKYFHPPFLSLFPVCIPAFIRQTARYHPENNSQTEAEQNLNDRLLNRPSDSPLRQKFPVSVGRTPFQSLKPPDKVLRVWPTDKACPHNTARWAPRPLPPFARKFIISAQKSSDLLPKLPAGIAAERGVQRQPPEPATLPA